MGKKVVEKLYYMNQDTVGTEISIGEDGKVYFENLAKEPIDCAFGVLESPVTREDLYDFLEDRCFPNTRGDCKRVLKKIDVPFYEPYDIVRKTHGIMFDDTYWIRFEGEEDLTYKEARESVGL